MGNAALQQLLQFFVNKADLRAKNDLAGRGGGADHTGSPGGFECLFVHLSAVFQLEAQPCGAATGFLHIGLTASAARMLAAMPAWSRSAFTTPSFSASFFFCSAALLVERATKKQITAATASSTGITIQTLGAAGARQRRRQSRRRTKSGPAPKKQATGRCVGMSSCYKVPPWVVYFCRCGKPAGGIYSSDFNIIKQEKKELNASFCPPKQKSRRQGHGGQPAAWNKGTRTLALAVT